MDLAILSVIRIVRDTLQGMLGISREFESTPLQLELLGISATLLRFVFEILLFRFSADEIIRPFPGLVLRSSIAFDILQLSALVRAFSIAENRERGSAPEVYRCDGGMLYLLGSQKGY